jgi:hypothetical protein
MSIELISIERYAEVLAHVQHFGHARAPEVRQRLEVDEAGWSASQSHWLDALDGDTRSPKPTLALVFARHYAKTSQRLSNDQPALDTIGGAPGPAVEDVPMGEGDPPVTSPVEPPRVGSPPVPAELESSTPPRASQPEDVSPWVKVTSTAGPPPPGWVPSRSSAHPTPRSVSRDQTAVVAALTDEAPLPFVKDAPARIKSRLGRPLAEATDVGGMTAAIPAQLCEGLATLPFKALPVQPSGAPLREPLTIEQYACLSAELVADPARTSHTLGRHGLDPSNWAATRAAWERRLAHDPPLQRRFDELFNHYRTWLAHHR